ncbi:MAG TPA: hypothetical protein VGO71_11825 [Baekduia sp.]|nr:hypothetical protein [Baekduia sp.]
MFYGTTSTAAKFHESPVGALWLIVAVDIGVLRGAMRLWSQ